MYLLLHIITELVASFLSIHANEPTSDNLQVLQLMVLISNYQWQFSIYNLINATHNIGFNTHQNNNFDPVYLVKITHASWGVYWRELS
jgi:hypothetical protein